MTTPNSVLRHYQSQAPIQTRTPTWERWLATSIRYETDYTVKDVLNEMWGLVDAWIASKEDLEPTMDPASLETEYTRVMFQGHESTRSTPAEDYFDLKYLEETYALFQRSRELAFHYDIGLTRTANDLHSFLRSVLEIADPDASEDPEETPFEANGWI
jgi:hypothetical protein